MLAYFKQKIEPENENLRKMLGIKTIVVKYQPHEEQVYVLTSGDVFTRDAIRDNQLDELGI